MHTVKVRRTGISTDQAATVIRQGLGDGYELEPDGDRRLEVRKGAFGRARIDIRDEAGGTVFDVRGQGPALPLLILTMKLVNDRGIARRTAEVIGQSEAFRDGG
jgi:hypothetical protein